MTARVDSYDRNAPTPPPGSRWVWEIDKPHAIEVIEVVETTWNGEEWWVRTKSLLPNMTYPHRTEDAWNDLSRFTEAVTPIGAGQSTQNRQEG